MPVAIIVIVIALGAIVGFTVLQNDETAETTSTPTEARPAEEESTSETMVEDSENDDSDQSDGTDASVDLNAPVGAFEGSVTEPTPEPSNEPVTSGSVYSDGTYTADAFYFTPSRTRHDMEITLEVENDIVVDANVTYDGGAARSSSHRRFDDAYGSAVIGVPLASLSLSRVGGASLTSEAFNEAVDDIEAQAS